MHSNTKMPLLQLVEFWGLDPYYFNGIDRKLQDNIIPNKKPDKCMCMLQNTWMQPQTFSRSDLIDTLNYAEQVFSWETGINVGLHQNYEHKVQYRKGKLQNKFGDYRAISLGSNCYFNKSGKLELHYIGEYEITKNFNGNYAEITFPVPEGTLVGDVRIYFTQLDAGYVNDPGINDYQYQIRPIRNAQILNNVYSAKIPLYLLKKPSLDEYEVCLPHVTETYVDELTAFYTTLSTCDHGYFIVSQDNCVGNCDDVLYPVCFEEIVVGTEIRLVPKPFRCNEDGEYEKYFLTQSPKAVSVNYSTKLGLTSTYDLEYGITQILSKLSVGLMDCIREWCDCDNCARQKLDYYRRIFKEKVVDINGNDQYQLILSEGTINLLTGYPIYVGMSMAFREMLNYKCLSTTGGYI